MACGLAPEVIAILSVTAGITLSLVSSVTYLQLKINNCIKPNPFCECFHRIICCEQRDIDATNVRPNATVKTIESQPPPYMPRENFDNAYESNC